MYVLIFNENYRILNEKPKNHSVSLEFHDKLAEVDGLKIEVNFCWSLGISFIKIMSVKRKSWLCCQKGPIILPPMTLQNHNSTCFIMTGVTLLKKISFLSYLANKCFQKFYFQTKKNILDSDLETLGSDPLGFSL